MKKLKKNKQEDAQLHIFIKMNSRNNLPLEIKNNMFDEVSILLNLFSAHHVRYQGQLVDLCSCKKMARLYLNMLEQFNPLITNASKYERDRSLALSVLEAH